jgi:thiol-disulfide isomerase/thioredoxin
VRITFGLTCLVLSFIATRATAQDSGRIVRPVITGTTPTECVNRANDWRTQQWNAAPPANRTSAYSATLVAEAHRIAGECGAKFSVDKTPVSGLRALADYFTFIGDTAGGRATLKRALAAKDLPPRDRVAILNQAIAREIAAASGYFGMLTGAERYVTELDALPDSFAEFKIRAHQTMLGRYEYLDVALGIQQHAKALLSLAKATGNTGVLTGAYLGLARASADMLHPDSALRILDNAERERGPTPQFAEFRYRYALIGTKAAPVTGQWWVNSSNPAERVEPGNGKVTLIEFTAHWCGPCKNSYPGLIELASRFAGKPFEGVMVTSLYGFIGTRRPLTPEQEVEADREYFAKEHALPFKVAINPTRGRPPESTVPTLDEAYRVSGIPQIMLVDKKGIIRQIVTGWDHGNTARFTTFIEQLLKEP